MKNEIKRIVNDFLIKLIKFNDDTSDNFLDFFGKLSEDDKLYCVRVFEILEKYHMGSITKNEAKEEYERIEGI